MRVAQDAPVRGDRRGPDRPNARDRPLDDGHPEGLRDRLDALRVEAGVDDGAGIVAQDVVPRRVQAVAVPASTSARWMVRGRAACRESQPSSCSWHDGSLDTM